MTRHCDYIIISGSSSGIASINHAATYGQKRALIEAKELSGICVDVDCVPKRVMWHATQVREAIHMYGPGYGFNATINKFDRDRPIAARTAYIDCIHTSYDSVPGKSNVDVAEGFTRFVDAKTVGVNDEIIIADHISVATGGRPSRLAVPSAEYGIDSNGFFELSALLECVTAVDIGYITIELAGMVSGLGAQTHLFIHEHAPLRSFDSMIVDTLVEVMNAEDPTLHTHAIPKAIIKNADGNLALQLEGGRSETIDCLTWAIGREPETNSFNLTITGMKINEKGYIVVDKFQNTSMPGIYAVGDSADVVELTPIAVTTGCRLSERLSNDRPGEHLDYNNILTVVLSHPSVGTAGLIEQQAYEQHDDDQMKVYKSLLAAMYTVAISHRQPCRMKLVCVDPKEKTVGIHGINFGMDEMLQGFAVVSEMGATKKDFDNTAVIRPIATEEFVTMH